MQMCNLPFGLRTRTMLDADGVGTVTLAKIPKLSSLSSSSLSLIGFEGD